MPEECKIEIYWQALPGETQSDVERDFLEGLEWLSSGPGSPIDARRALGR